MRDKTKLFIGTLIISSLIMGASCSGGGGGGGGPTDPCQGVNIVVGGTSTNTSAAGANDGSIAATASGGSGFTFSINSGPYQASGNFNGLAAGNYTVTAKDNRGCTGSRVFTIANADPCAGQTFTVSGNVVNTLPCAPSPTGSIVVTTANGGANFTYNLNGGAFQPSATFPNLAAGNYTVGAKEGGGCVKTAVVTVGSQPMGPLFSAVKTIINNNCAVAGCHVPPAPSGGINFQIDCNIVQYKDLIKFRAVDSYGTAQQMPPPPAPGLPLADRNAIVNWINAGGTYAN